MRHTFAKNANNFQESGFFAPRVFPLTHGNFILNYRSSLFAPFSPQPRPAKTTLYYVYKLETRPNGLNFATRAIRTCSSYSRDARFLIDGAFLEIPTLFNIINFLIGKRKGTIFFIFNFFARKILKFDQIVLLSRYLSKKKKFSHYVKFFQHFF